MGGGAPQYTVLPHGSRPSRSAPSRWAAMACEERAAIASPSWGGAEGLRPGRGCLAIARCSCACVLWGSPEGHAPLVGVWGQRPRHWNTTTAYAALAVFSQWGSPEGFAPLVGVWGQRPRGGGLVFVLPGARAPGPLIAGRMLIRLAGRVGLGGRGPRGGVYAADRLRITAPRSRDQTPLIRLTAAVVTARPRETR